MKKLYMVLLLGYFLLLCININKLSLFIGDEGVYAQSVSDIISGIFNTNNHPLLAKTIWAFFIYTFQGATGIYTPFIWRLGTLLCSIGILIIFYNIARLFFSEKVSLLASAILAIDPMFFAMSRIMQPDIPAIFFGISSLYYFLLYQKNDKSINLYNAGVLGGLSLAAKMYAIIPVFSLPLILFLTCRTGKIQILKRSIVYYCLIFLGFVCGNLVLFFLKDHFNFIHYSIELIRSQTAVPFSAEGYLNSPAWSWFTIPQILTLYRTYSEAHPNVINEILVFQNPASFILTIPAFIITTFYTIKEKANRYLWLTLIWTFISTYFPWFLRIHMTYYYYILPLIPLIILFIFRLLEKINNKKTTYLYIGISLIIFIVYYPLLNGIKVNKNYDNIFFKYSMYNYPYQNRIFCKKCSPRN